MQINSASEEDMLLSELSVIYSISSLAFFQDEEDLLQAALNIATLSFGVHYFGLIHLCNGDYSVKISNGFKNPEHMIKKIRGDKKQNQFIFSFKNLEKPMILFMEHNNPVTDRERRVYTIFAKNLETALNNAQNLQKKVDAEKELKKSLNEKDMLLKEIHHRVKNNMQIVSSLLSLQSGHVEGTALNILQESQNRVKSMAMIHEKLYQSGDLTRIDFADYIYSIVSDLFSSYGVDTSRVASTVLIEDIFLEIETAVPLGLIVNELVSNSLKHAFPGNSEGNIRVRIHEHQDGYHLHVEDEGLGIPEDFDLNSQDSLGFQLVKALTKQLEGSINLDRQNGTAFKVIFHELKYKKRI